jgi:hypothetical protein
MQKKYVEVNLQKMTLSIGNQLITENLSKLLYRSSPNVQQCYVSSSALTSCIDGLCKYRFNRTSTTNEHLYPPVTWACLPDNDYAAVEISFYDWKALPGLTTYDSQLIDFTCNIEKCNGPAIVASVLRVLLNQSGNEIPMER